MVERRVVISGQWTRSHAVEVRVCQVTLIGLHPGQVYQFRVRAYNAVACQYRNTAVLRPFRSGQRHGAILRPKIFVLIHLNLDLHREKQFGPKSGFEPRLPRP